MIHSRSLAHVGGSLRARAAMRILRTMMFGMSKTCSEMLEMAKGRPSRWGAEAILYGHGILSSIALTHTRKY